MIINKKNEEIIKLKKNGVVFLDETSTIIGENVSIGKNTIIYPGVILYNNVIIGESCTIQAYTTITDNINIKNHVFIGPYSFIRNNVNIEDKCAIGPHCEITRSTLNQECKIGHKNFIGDAILGTNVKFGAGAIIANSDWENTYLTTIGNNTLIGVNSCIIAPRKIGKNVLVAAGSTITADIEDNTLAIARARQENKPKRK